MILAGVAALSLIVGVGVSKALEDAKEIKGVLIDQACGGKQMSKDDPEAAAAKHPKDCCLKDGCSKSGYAVISGKKMYKLDDAGAAKAKEYLEKNDSTKVVVKGTEKDEKLSIESIEPQKEEK
jgi:hypothetical protein